MLPSRAHYGGASLPTINEAALEAAVNAVASTLQAWDNTSGMPWYQRAYVTAAGMIGESVGAGDVEDLRSGRTSDGDDLTWGGRVYRGVTGLFKLGATAFGAKAGLGRLRSGKTGGGPCDDVAPMSAPNHWASNPQTFTRTADFTPTTGRTYKVFQRNDIAWDQVRTEGPRDFIGMTNAEAARAGLRPQLPDGNFATLHHSQQNALGPWFEASTRYHNIRNAQRAPLHPHGQSGHPHNPMGRGPGSPREQFQEIESPEYWIWREANR